MAGIASQKGRLLWIFLRSPIGKTLCEYGAGSGTGQRAVTLSGVAGELLVRVFPLFFKRSEESAVRILAARPDRRARARPAV